ncbi:hypothetical protein FRZ06_06290 [Anoxybacterium hadale]|uniref:Uncharacterized protein n=1 Tax=Anoxybacterium hadale TaxID=3408580 RepID=A0ACD1A971_9FIRM|nr:hypothetical protein FRZ06_06290 [Clostridiales bacterium]
MIKLRFRTIILVITLILMQSAAASANSAPTYWEGYPYSEVLLVDEASPIEVKREKLIFDYNSIRQEQFGFSPTAAVTAEYQMMNSSNADQRVQMAFSLVSSLAELSVKDLIVETDGSRVSYEVYPAMEAAEHKYDSDAHFRYGGFHISTAEYELPGFDLNQKAQLVRYRIKPAKEENLRFEVIFNADPKQTRLIGKNFNMASYTEGKGSSIGAGLYKDKEKVVEVLVLGEAIHLETEVLTEDGVKADPADFYFEEEVSSVDPRKYLMDEIHRDLRREITTAVDETQLLNLYLSRIWSDGLVAGYSLLDEALSASHEDRVITLLYSVDFPAGSERTIRVGYLTGGTMDRRETSSPQYHYTYLLSPAKHWKSFGELELEIRTPEKAPFVIESSLPLTLDGERRYITVLDGLPEDELLFTLYHKEQITSLDKVEKSLDGLRYVPFFIAMFWPFLLAGIILIIILLWSKKARIRN